MATPNALFRHRDFDIIILTAGKPQEKEKTGGTTMSFANYVKNYEVGSIRLDAPYAHFVHELPILSFGDILHTVNLSLVYQSKMTDNPFNISNGFKLNLQKRIIFSSSGIPKYFEEGNGSQVPLNYSDAFCTFNDDTQRILKKQELAIRWIILILAMKNMTIRVE